jgi:hypothetical protein
MAALMWLRQCPRWGQMGAKQTHWAGATGPALPMNSGFMGRWDRNRTGTLRFWRPHPACRVVSVAIANCRSAPLALSSSAADCRRVSAVTGADSGAAAASAGTLLAALTEVGKENDSCQMRHSIPEERDQSYGRRDSGGLLLWSACSRFVGRAWRASARVCTLTVT